MGMRPKTRLDSVIKLEEEKEGRRLQEMAAAGRQVKSAEAALTGAREAARTDHRRAASATDWLVAEMAHTRALLDIRSAENAVKSAAVTEGATRNAYTQAHSKAEALRRVAQARVEEILTSREKAESKELDDIGLLSFNCGPRAV
jgi:flagellar export protein FliJ